MELKTIFSQKSTKIVSIPLKAISPNPSQPRKSFDESGIRSLAASINENGLICPITVRKTQSGYEIIAGERRFLAFGMLGRDTIPAIIEQADDERSAVLALIENLQRRDLNFLEEALAIEMLLRDDKMTRCELAQRLSMSRSALANKLRLLQLPRDVLERLAQADATERHARALLPLCGDERLSAAAEYMLSKKLTVEKTEQMVKKYLMSKHTRGSRRLILRDLRLFTTTINRAVDVMKEAGIEASSVKTENESAITYTIVIPKPGCASA